MMVRTIGGMHHDVGPGGIRVCSNLFSATLANLSVLED